MLGVLFETFGKLSIRSFSSRSHFAFVSHRVKTKLSVNSQKQNFEVRMQN